MNQGHYKPWSVGGVVRANVFDLLGLGAPGIPHQYVTEQSYRKRRKAVLNYPMVGERTPSTVKGHWLQAKTTRHLIRIGWVFPAILSAH